MMNKNIAIITGATGGIGKEFVKQMVSEQVDEIWAVARNNEKLAVLCKEFGKKIIPISLDLSKLDDIKRLESKLESEQPNISFLVNNAGLAKMASYKDFSIEEIDATVNLNCKAVVLMCKICIPHMSKGSHILNLTSASSFQPTPYINLYASSKVFERSYSRSLNVELKGTGIIATAVCPSWVDTDMISHNINGKEVKFPGLVTADQVVTKAMKDCKKGNDMSVCSFYVKCQHLYCKLLPQRFIMKQWMKGIKDYI